MEMGGPMPDFLKLIRIFRSKDDGAVTVDWVVITAVIVGLSFPLVAMIKGGQDILAVKISSSVSAKSPD